MVRREGLDLGVQFRVVPIRLRHRRLEIVQHDPLRNPAKVPECVFQALDEHFGRLSPHHFAIPLAGMRQDHAKHPRSPAFAILSQNPGPLAEIHLGLDPRRRFQPAKR